MKIIITLLISISLFAETAKNETYDDKLKKSRKTAITKIVVNDGENKIIINENETKRRDFNNTETIIIKKEKSEIHFITKNKTTKDKRNILDGNISNLTYRDKIIKNRAEKFKDNGGVSKNGKLYIYQEDKKIDKNLKKISRTEEEKIGVVNDEDKNIKESHIVIKSKDVSLRTFNNGKIKGNNKKNQNSADVGGIIIE